MLPLLVRAAPATEVKRLGILAHGSKRETLEYFETTDRKALARLGWVEGRNLHIEWRFTDGQEPRYEALAKELVDARVDVIATASTLRTRAVLKATRTIPVFTVVGDPVGAGFATSLARPGGNVTGLSLGTAEIAKKQIELLRATVPRISNLMIVSTTSMAGMRMVFEPLARAAREGGISVEMRQVVSLSNVETAFRALALESAGQGAAFVGNLRGVDARAASALALRLRVPTIGGEGFVRSGGLMSFSLTHHDDSERSAAIIDKLLRGADPAITPFELPSKSRFAINRKTAAAIGVTFPADFALRADEVIE